MAKQTCTDYADELRFQAQIWARKPGLRALYGRWYARVVTALSPQRPVVEIGAGCGNFKAHFSAALATDAIRGGPWIDRIVDARAMPFAPGEVGNFVLIDCLHHLPRPLRFLRAASAALKPGGRIVLFEPACTPWARLVWRFFHHEPVDLRQDLFAEDALPEPENAGLAFTNMGIATVLFVKGREKTMRCLPELKLARLEYSDFVVYPATGGFSYLSLMPAFALPALHATERVLTSPFGSWLTGMRLLIVLEKRPNEL